jgi:hypothetical protein
MKQEKEIEGIPGSTNDTRQENLNSKLKTDTKLTCNFQRDIYLTMIAEVSAGSECHAID